MRKLAILLFFSVSINSSGQKKVFVKSFALINRIFIAYSRMEKFEDLDENTNSNNYADSIRRYNNILSFIFSSPEFKDLKKADLNKIEDSTEIKILVSADKKLKVVSWCIFDFYPTPLCSSIMVPNGIIKSKIISFNENSKMDFGNNVQIDTIVEITSKRIPYYFLFGSNKCGNLCVQRIASGYSIFDGSIRKCSNIFYDGKNYFDDVEFNYLLSEKIKPDPTFQIQSKQLICPFFNDDRTKETGSKSYKILLK